MSSFFRTYWKSVVVLLVIFVLSTYPFPPDNALPKIKHADKVVHVMLYALFSFTLYFDSTKTKQVLLNKRNFYLVVLLFPFLYGGLIEILQELFFPPRTAEWLDWLSDLVGVMIGFGAGKLLFKNR